MDKILGFKAKDVKKYLHGVPGENSHEYCVPDYKLVPVVSIKWLEEELKKQEYLIGSPAMRAVLIRLLETVRKQAGVQKE